MIKGWVMDEVPLKEGTYLSDKYFDDQLGHVSEIQRKRYTTGTDSVEYGHRINSELDVMSEKTILIIQVLKALEKEQIKALILERIQQQLIEGRVRRVCCFSRWAAFAPLQARQNISTAY
ncbi:MAG: hypothetical protein LKF96_11835 [Treponema sp.]|jgi:hypothetical protein|nr:hypothetical protein [Treponema sp.]